MSVLANNKNSFSQKDFKANAQKIQACQLNVQLFQDVVKNEIEKNKITYLYPGKIGAAEVHRQANKYGYHPRPKGQPPKVCACCQELVQNEELPICYSTSSLTEQQKLGYEQFKLEPGLALFFQFIKLTIFYLIFRIILCDGFNIATNIVGSYCKEAASDNPCQQSIWNYLSILNIIDNKNFIFIQQILDLITVVLSIIIFFFLRKKQYNFGKELKEKKQSEDTYTILVSNIPLIDFPTDKQLKKMKRNSKNMELWHRKHLWKFFQHKIKKWLKKQGEWKLSKGTTEHDFHQMKQKNGGQLRSTEIVTSVSLAYNLGRLQILKKKKNDLIERQKEYEKIRDKIDQQLSDGEKDKQFGVQPIEQDLGYRFSTIPRQVEFLNDCQILLSKQYASDNSVLFNMTNLVGYAFISFQYQHYKEYILSQNSKNSSFLSYNGVRLTAESANQPSDVRWDNFRHSQSKRLKRILTTISFVVLVILITFGLVVLIQYFRLSNTNLIYNSKEDLGGNMKPLGMVLAIILLIIFSNFIVRKLVKHFVQRQKHKSTTQQKISQLKAATLGQFFNSAIVLFIASRIYELYFGNFVGLVFIVTAYVIINVILSLILQILYPSSIWSSLKFCCKYRNYDHEDSVQKFQIKLNQDYDYQNFDIVEKYSQYLALVLFASFYAHLTPIIVPIVAVYMFFIFWVDKINIFRRSKVDYRSNFAVAREAIKILQSSIFFFSIGAIIISFYTLEDLAILELVSLLISFLFVLFLLLVPYGLERKIFARYQSSSKQTYDDCVADGKFLSTYWYTNPATYLVKENDLVDRKSIYNPVVKKIYVNEYSDHY